MTPHKLAVRAHFDSLVPRIERWQRASRYYRQQLQRLCTFAIPPGASVLELALTQR